MKNTILFLTALFAVLPAFSRDVKGRILDENKAPLDFVNVVLYCDDSSVLSDTKQKITDKMEEKGINFVDVSLIDALIEIKKQTR